jgi:hypothetical protein
MEKVCSPKCALEYVQLKNDKARAKEEKAFRAETRRLKQSIKRAKDYIPAAQKQFNRFIRLNDHGEPCISCGLYEHEIIPGPTGTWDCGHFIGVGANCSLRFEEDNAHKQCYLCNRGSASKRDRKGIKREVVSKEYRIRLIDKIGIDRVEWLEGPHEPKKHTIEDLKEITAMYKKKAKELEKQIEHN